MMMSRTLLAAFAVSAVAGFSHVAAAEDEATHFICTFDKGSSWTYDAGKFQSTPSATLVFEIGSVDLEGQSATLIINGKPDGKLRIVRALNANHFLEVANEGFLNLTTIYDLDATVGTYPAVHSRHFGVVGQPVFAQYAGTCVSKPAK